MKTLLFLALFIPLLCFGQTGKMPPNAIQYLPTLKKLSIDIWPTLKLRSFLGGQVEQETCISPTSKGCWNPKAELKTKREYGFGLGQATIAYDANGNERFNIFKEQKKLDKRLADWKWEDRYDPEKQLIGFVRFSMQSYLMMKFTTASEEDRIAFALSAYNGGTGGVLNDRKLCISTTGCDPSRWFDNVEKYSFKAKIKVQGYGQSFYEINRGYVKNVLKLRRFKYIPFLEK